MKSLFRIAAFRALAPNDGGAGGAGSGTGGNGAGQGAGAGQGGATQTVTFEQYNALLAQHNQTSTLLTSLQTELAELKSKGADTAKLQQQLDDAQKTVATATKAAQDAQLVAAASAAGFHDPNLAPRLVDAAKAQVKDGVLTNASDLITDLVKTSPFLVKTAGNGGNVNAGAGGGSGTGSPTDMNALIRGAIAQ